MMSFVESLSGTALLLSFMTFVLATFLVLKRKKNQKGTAKPKYGLPPIGPAFAEFYPDMMNAQNQSQAVHAHGTIFTISSPLKGIVPTQVVICEPHLVKDLCVKQANMFRPPSHFTTRVDAFAYATRQVIGTSVSGLKGEEWLWRKTALLKEFHKHKLLDMERGLLEIVYHEGMALCEELEKAADSKTVIQADHLTTEATVAVALFFLFGRRLEFNTNQMRKAAKDLIDCLFVRFTNPLYEILKYIPMTNPYKMELRTIHARQVIDTVVETELELLLEEFHGNKPIHPERKEGSVIASLIAEEPKFRIGGKEVILAEVRNLVVAGFDATAHSLAFAMGMMAERPDLADQMAKQGMDNFYNLPQSEPVNFETIELLKKALYKSVLVKNFFMEALRLYPIVPTLRGECASNIDIFTKDGTHYTLPKGTLTLFLNMQLQRQEIPDPNKICPERWDVPITEQPFLHTFQNGPHRCPGKPLSLLEGHAFLLLIASKFRFEFPKGITQVQFEDNGFLRPRDSMPLLVKRRNE